MFLPNLNSIPGTTRVLSQFGGLDLRHGIAPGSFAGMQNLTSDAFPLLASRKKRSLVAKTGPIGGMAAKDALCYVNGKSLFINGNPVDMDLTAGEKQLVSMGAYLVIFPDKKYINTLDPTDRGNLEATWVSEGSVAFSLCTADGSSYNGMVTGAEAPETPKEQQYWLDTSVSPCVLRSYSIAAESWIPISPTYVRLQAQGIGTLFSPYDGVEISGVAADALQALNGAAVLQAVGEDFVVIPGMLEHNVTQDPDQGAVQIARCVPELDFVVEADNRLWGCRYGFDRTGAVVNALYACKLGDFKNWNCFQGLSTDSYQVSLGADGCFTGAVTHLGYPLFFRENCLHKVYGSYPENYKVQTTACRGVAQGSHKSLAIVDGALYYLGIGGVCVYDGSLPEVVSAALGTTRWQNGVAGSLGSKYYIAMSDGEGPGLYVLDTRRNLWHREDALDAKCFCARGESLFCHDGENLWDLAGVTGNPEESVKWVAQTGHLTAADPGKQYISRVNVRLTLENQSISRCYARYDGIGGWEHLGTIRGRELRTVSFPMRTRRCESVELRLTGTGTVRIHSLAITAEEGSGLP